jgi:predicted GIY-YIG superfamily endonuclease
MNIAKAAYPASLSDTPLKRLVYVEFHERIADAIQRESNIKHWPRAWKARLILDAKSWLE